MGACVTNDAAWAERLRFLQKSIGAVPSAFDCWLALRGLKTLSVRMKAHGQSALCIAKWLESHKDVETVIYPGLPSHPRHATAAKLLAPRARASASGLASAGASNGALHSNDGSGANGANGNAGEGFPFGGMVTFRLRSDPADDRPADRLLNRVQIFTLAESLGGVER